MTERFVLLGLDFESPIPPSKRVRATFRVRHIRESKEETFIEVPPISMNVTTAEAVKAKAMIYTATTWLTLRRADEHRKHTTLESADGKLILILPPGHIR